MRQAGPSSVDPTAGGCSEASPSTSMIVMGVNDAEACRAGWSQLEASDPRHGQVRWVNNSATLVLKAPPQPSFVGLEIFVPRGLAQSRLRVTARAPGGGHTYVEAQYPLNADQWDTLDFPLAAIPDADAEVEIALTLERAPRRWSWHAGGRGIAVRRVWLRGNRLQASEITIVVLNWKRGEETAICLESLAQADLDGASVLVVDNGSGDGSVELLRARFPDQRILALPENLGYAGGNNAGIRAALADGARGVVLLNNDTTVAKDFLGALLWGLNRNRSVGAVASAILRKDQPDTLELAWLDIYFGHGLVHRRGVNKMPGEGYDHLKDVEVAVGCCLLLTADALEDVGLLDESYFAYHEEVDWCWRARQAGYKIFYDPFSRVWHGGSKSTDILIDRVEASRTLDEVKPSLPHPVALPWNPIRTYLGARNALRFVRKHGSLRQQLYFAASSAYAIPLELLAVIMRREELLWLGLWTYRKALSLYCLESDGADTAQLGAVQRWLRIAARLPRALLVRLPRDVRDAVFDGRTAQLQEHVRGLWDGVRDRPLPLARLGLRPPRVAAHAVTIIVLNWNGAADTLACLDSLAAADLGGASVMVVDNGSTDGSVEQIRRRFPDVQIVALHENQGYAGGNNAGMRAALDAGAQGVVLLNNDTTVSKEFLTELLKQINSSERVAAVSGAILNMDRPDTLDVAWLEVTFRHGLVRRHGVNALPGEGFNRCRQIDVAVGSCVMIAADVLREIGLFDEAYFAYHEEVDWCWRARRAGYTIYYNPFALIWHSGSKSTEALNRTVATTRVADPSKPQLPNAVPLAWNPIRTYLGARNAVRFVRKNGNLWHKLRYAASSLYAVPLELLAVLTRNEELLWLHLFPYRKALATYALDADGEAAAALRGPQRWLRVALRLPQALSVRLPRDIEEARVDGRTAQLEEHVRGLWDGIRDRPLPLERLGLRPPRVTAAGTTIVVLNWKRAAETIACLESLAQADLGGASVLVVDNGSEDGSVEAIRARFPDQPILALPQNVGYAGGNNAGIRAALDAGAQAVVLLNNDTKVAKDFLGALLTMANAGPNVGAVSSAILSMERPETLDVAWLDIYFGHGIVLRQGVNALPGEGFDQCRDVDVAVGCCVLLTADALRDVGLFDEAFFAYHEEVDWCFRARRAGYRILYQPFARVWHGGSKSTGELNQPMEAQRTTGEVKEQLANPVPLMWNPIRTYLGARNAVRFIKKNANPYRKLFFIASSLYAIPLELLAVIMRQEEYIWLGLWTYRRAITRYCLGPHAGELGPLQRWLRIIVRLPYALLVRLPRDVRTAQREGRTAQLEEHMRGLWDGLRNRPLPLERLGLRRPSAQPDVAAQ